MAYSPRTIADAGTNLDTSALALNSTVAKDGTDITTPSPAMPTGGVGIRGWLSAIWTKLNGSLAVTMATNTPDVTDRVGRLLGVVASITAAVDVSDRAARLLGVIYGSQGAQLKQTATNFNTQVELAVGAGLIDPRDVSDRGARALGVVTNANIDVLLSTRLKPADTLTGVTTVTTVSAVTAITNALPAGTNKVGTVDIATAPATAKGTQGANAVPTQDLKDAGRNQVHFYTLIPVLSSATDTLQSLTGTKAGLAVTATTTPAVVTAAKTLRITRLAATYIATATSGYGTVRLRFNTGGVVVIGSPVAATMAVGSGTPATANATGAEEATLSDGWEFAAGTGIGISVQGFAAVTATAVGYVLVSVTGYEY